MPTIQMYIAEKPLDNVEISFSGVEITEGRRNLFSGKSFIPKNGTVQLYYSEEVIQFYSYQGLANLKHIIQLWNKIYRLEKPKKSTVKILIQ